MKTENIYKYNPIESKNKQPIMIRGIEKETYREAKKEAKAIGSYQDIFNSYLYTLGLEMYVVRKRYENRGQEEEYKKAIDDLIKDF